MHTLKYTASLHVAKFTNQSTLIWSKQSMESTTTLQEFTVTWQIVKMIVFHYPIQIFQKKATNHIPRLFTDFQGSASLSRTFKAIKAFKFKYFQGHGRTLKQGETERLM